MTKETLKKWDGKQGTSWKYDTSFGEYYIDGENNVYYVNGDGEMRLWCAGFELSAHCHHLQQIAWR